MVIPTKTTTSDRAKDELIDLTHGRGRYDLDFAY
jgi:hypothetical protein